MELHLLGSCSPVSGPRSRSLALRKGSAWWESSVSTARAGPYPRAPARDQEIKGGRVIEVMPADHEAISHPRASPVNSEMEVVSRE